MNLSLGERPVWLPVVAQNTPLAASWPSPRANAYSTRTLGERFQWIVPRLTKPYSSNAFLLIIIVIVHLCLSKCEHMSSHCRYLHSADLSKPHTCYVKTVLLQHTA